MTNLSRTTKGAAHSVPCPCCAKPQNLLDMAETRELDSSIDTGMEIQCDKCGRIMVVVAVHEVTIVQGRAKDLARPGVKRRR